MSVQPADLLAPSGLIESSLLDEEGEALEERLQAYITEAANQGSPSDEATKAYAYYRTFLAVYLQISSSPESVSMDEQGTALMHTNQAARFLDLSREWEGRWNGFIDLGRPGTNLGTGAASNSFVW